MARSDKSSDSTFETPIKEDDSDSERSSLSDFLSSPECRIESYDQLLLLLKAKRNLMKDLERVQEEVGSRLDSSKPQEVENNDEPPPEKRRRQQDADPDPKKRTPVSAKDDIKDEETIIVTI